MSVYKRGKVFYMGFVVNGLRVFKSTKKHTKREAKQVEAAEKHKMLHGKDDSPQQRAGKMLLNDAIEQLYETKWKNNKDGMGSYRRAVKLSEYLGNVPLSSIGDEDVDDLVRKLDGKGVAVATVNRYLATMKTILKHIRLQTDFIRLRKERKGRIRVLSKDEVCSVAELLREAVKYGKLPYYMELADLVEVLVDSGMRLSEALRLEYKDVDFSSNLISIWIKKGEKPRSIPMTSRVRNILQERQVTNPVKVFDITIDECERAWQWVREQMNMKADEEFVLHALRHTCASRLVNAGVDLYVVKEWLGHSSIQITERYAHLNSSKLVHAVKALGG